MYLVTARALSEGLGTKSNF